LTRVMPTPHPATTCVIKLSGSLIGATGAACTEVATKASAAKAINLIIRASHVFKKEIFLTRG
jgi:anti-anti-sigma regulatory factor